MMDNQSMLNQCMAKGRTKRNIHVDTKWLIAKSLHGNELELMKVHTDFNGADWFTKSLCKDGNRHLQLQWWMHGHDVHTVQQDTNLPGQCYP